ncbi:putative Two pore calcium channel protein 1, plant [Helianthus annuus]|nr:putative Two pore calcium channel protein 1, plant [Helianthus annuus]
MCLLPCLDQNLTNGDKKHVLTDNIVSSIRYLLIARMLRLIRLLMRYQTYRTFVATFLTLIPSLMPYLGTVFWVMCIYCTLGIQIFGGLVNAGNPDLPATDLADNDEYDNLANCYKDRSYIACCSVDLTIISYLLFNFNDYPNGMVTLFNLLVMGNWQVWMQDYATLTGTSWTYAYFISFYLITILLLLNLVVAFVLEAFFAELELEYPEEEGNVSNLQLNPVLTILLCVYNVSFVYENPANGSKGTT